MRQAKPVAQVPRLCGTHSVLTSLILWGLDVPNIKLMSIVTISGVINFALKELSLAEETETSAATLLWWSPVQGDGMAHKRQPPIVVLAGQLERAAGEKMGTRP